MPNSSMPFPGQHVKGIKMHFSCRTCPVGSPKSWQSTLGHREPATQSSCKSWIWPKLHFFWHTNDGVQDRLWLPASKAPTIPVPSICTKISMSTHAKIHLDAGDPFGRHHKRESFPVVVFHQLMSWAQFPNRSIGVFWLCGSEVARRTELLSSVGWADVLHLTIIGLLSWVCRFLHSLRLFL